MTEPKPTKAEPQTAAPKSNLRVEQIRARNFRKMLTLVNRVHVLPGGERLFVRFDQAEILEHWVLLGSFTILAVTGLLEMLAHSSFIADIITLVFRTIDNVRSLHDFSAFLYAGLALVHFLRVVARWFVKGDQDLLIPSKGDMKELGRNWKYLLSRNAPRPAAGRFTIDQKLTYWALAGFSVIMLLTALTMWLQTPVMQFMPAGFLPIVRSLHSLIGVLAIVTLLPWHIYNTVLKEWNNSIFTGVMDEKTIRNIHPLEHRQILAAVDIFQNFRAETTRTTGQPVVDQLETAHEHRSEAVNEEGSKEKTGSNPI